jgi:hypothetical protein
MILLLAPRSNAECLLLAVAVDVDGGGCLLRRKEGTGIAAASLLLGGEM